jgi:hypothetical protein
MIGNDLWLVAVLITLVACSGKHRPFADGSAGSGGIGASPGAAGTMQARPGSSEVGEGMVVSQPGQEGPIATGSIQPTGAMSDPATISCDGDGGPCSSTVEPGDGGGCVPTGPRDCTSDLDNDCDGQADRALDDVCLCAPGSVEPCDEHPGMDGRGQCRPGSRTCIVGEGNLTSDWGVCEGSIGPAEQDSCAFEGDDADCDGTNNGGCPCVDGEMQPCGPDTENGICARGLQTCANGRFGECVGAAFPVPRHCGSPQDNDCDGRPDNTIDNVCECIPGQGNGPCSGDANNSRCNSQAQCVPCQTNNDCSLVSGGRDTCDTGGSCRPGEGRACQQGGTPCANNLPCVGGVCGVPLLANGAICTANNQCASARCLDWYRDQDGDGFGTVTPTLRTCGVPNVTPPPNGLLATSGDCCDTDEDAHPGQPLFFNVPRNVCGGFNYDCINGDEFSPSRVGVTSCEQLVVPNCDAKLWTDGLGGVGVRPPPCGTAGGATFCGSLDNFTCTAISGGELLSTCR